MYSVYEVSACTASLTTSSVILWFISIFKLQVSKGCFVESAWNINAAPVLHKHIRSAQYFRDICHGSECLEDFKKIKMSCQTKCQMMWDVSCGCLLRGVAVWSTFPTWSKENGKVLKVPIEVVKIPCFCRCLCDGDVHTSMSSWATETTRPRSDRKSVV